MSLLSHPKIDFMDSDHQNDSDAADGKSTASVDTGLSPSTSRNYHEHDDDSASIARKENNAVSSWRVVVMAFLVACTIGVGIAVYRYARNGEIDEFYTLYQDDSFKTLEAIGNHLDLKMGAIDSFVVPLVSFANISQQEWPFVNIADYANRASKIRSMSSAIAIEQYQIVEFNQKAAWEKYAASNQEWVQEALRVQTSDPTFQGTEVSEGYIDDEMPEIEFDGLLTAQEEPLYAFSWQQYPVVSAAIPYNMDALQHPIIGPAMRSAISTRNVVISEVLNLPNLETPESEQAVQETNEWASKHVDKSFDASEPLVGFLYPVLNTAAASVNDGDADAEIETRVVGVVSTTFYWSSFLKDILPAGDIGLLVVFENACNQSFTFEVNGPDVVYLGPGDLHDEIYSSQGLADSMPLVNLINNGQQYYSGLPMSTDFCAYTVSTYASTSMEQQILSNDPFVFMAVAVCIFLFTALVFLLYDKLVERRQQKVMSTAVKSTAIVSSLFPSNVRDRLFKDSEIASNDSMNVSLQSSKNQLKSFLNDGRSSSDTAKINKPIADLFLNCTVSFADIANFTAWSSVREPSMVFTLLETVYGAFDQIALRRGVFKVETIGDSYVAVTGLPEPRKDHAVAMAKFASECRKRFKELCQQLEEQLGPETGELGIRIGMNSGAVTAGVLRGQKSRFQLFGDTVNTAARMESTGKSSHIQASSTTADLLQQSGKAHWVTPRNERIEAKGKGLLQTYWIEPIRQAPQVEVQSQVQMPSIIASLDQKTERLVSWNVEILSRSLRKVVNSRKLDNALKLESLHWRCYSHSNIMILEEVKEVIELPESSFDVKEEGDSASPPLDPLIRAQLQDYVTAIAMTYQHNPFHNFEHASHVCMSVSKLLSRITAPDQMYHNLPSAVIGEAGQASSVHDHTYGIASNALTQFACVFSALIHDAEHPGVPNSQLVKEDSHLSKLYKCKSIAEQNSFNVAWQLLQHDKFAALRACISATQEEATHFRQVVVNSVMATDIIDRDLKKLRDQRWENAFQKDAFEQENLTSLNRKATIVIEHLIQASDVAHTMQHWHVYRKWNERLFNEMYKAYQQGRAEKDPSLSWYEGELKFFDFYILPLAKKLSECAVFGVSSDEYFNYALENRREWEKKGEHAVANMVKKFHSASAHS